MARSSDVVKKILRLKLQLSDAAEPATVLKILQKLNDLDITIDILAETGIGKTVNSFRRHKQAGELAKSLVKGWKKLVPKQSTSSHREDGALSESVSIKNIENGQCFQTEDSNNTCLTSNDNDQDSSDEAPFKTDKKKGDIEERQLEDKRRKTRDDKKNGTSQRENSRIFQKNISKSKTEIKEDKADGSAASKKKKKSSSTLFGSKNIGAFHHKSRYDSREELRRTSKTERFESKRESNTKSKQTKESSLESRDSFSSSDKPSKKVRAAKDDRTSEKSRSSEKNRKRKNSDQERHDALKSKPDSENKDHSKHKKARMEQKDLEINSDPGEPLMSFESYLNYDLNIFKKKEQSGVKKVPKTIKATAKEQTTKDPGVNSPESPGPVPEQVQESIMHLMDVPLPAALPELDKPLNVDYYTEKKVEKEPDYCDVPEESAVFTGQRLNRKMQVYSGTKTLFLPTMMSLYQQCIRTLQNNINLLYETGGVPFELLEPVLERCTPEQLLRIEEYNPIYIGVTDHLWGKHCKRDFKDHKLQEYESWKEMYIRLSEERERKLQRLTKSIVSSHSKKPKGRQVKMAFIHTVAKPPRDVRIQQEIHGTAVQQPHQSKCSVKHQDNQMRSTCNDSSRSGSTSSGGSNTQDPRKKPRVAPMMAKSLKAFKKQLGRR